VDTSAAQASANPQNPAPTDTQQATPDGTQAPGSKASSEPKLERREAQPYAAIRAKVAGSEIGAKLPPLIGEVAAWLGSKGSPPSGAPFFRYLVVDMPNELQVEVGFPVNTALKGTDRIVTGTLPAGTYATVVHRGSPRELEAVTADLLAWGKSKAVKWDMQTLGHGEKWVARLEFYLTDPKVEPDMAKWETELAFKTADK
jgi:effector-binding domain-containing protein